MTHCKVFQPHKDVALMIINSGFGKATPIFSTSTTFRFHSLMHLQETPIFFDSLKLKIKTLLLKIDFP